MGFYCFHGCFCLWKHPTTKCACLLTSSFWTPIHTGRKAKSADTLQKPALLLPARGKAVETQHLLHRSSLQNITTLRLQIPSKKVLWGVFRGLNTFLEGIWSPRAKWLPLSLQHKVVYPTKHFFVVWPSAKAGNLCRLSGYKSGTESLDLRLVLNKEPRKKHKT